MKVTVTQGSMIVNSVLLVADEPNFKLIDIDLRSKYPGQCAFMCDSRDVMQVRIPWSAYSLLVAPTNDDTVVSIEFPGAEDWEVVTDGGRYTVRVVLWRRPVGDVAKGRLLYERSSG